MRGFGDLESAIMDQVWSAGRPLLVREIQQALSPERAYNTVWTVTEILYRKGWLVRGKAGRAYLYRATVSRDEYTGDLIGEGLAASGGGAGRERSMIAAAALLGYATLLLTAGAPVLARAGWPERAPRLAMAAWIAL